MTEGVLVAVQPQLFQDRLQMTEGPTVGDLAAGDGAFGRRPCRKNPVPLPRLLRKHFAQFPETVRRGDDAPAYFGGLRMLEEYKSVYV